MLARIITLPYLQKILYQEVKITLRQKKIKVKVKLSLSNARKYMAKEGV
jgi:hypothetical protein